MSQEILPSLSTVDYYTKGNDLFLKYFLIDSSFNTRGWSVDHSQIARLAKEAIGKPFTDYEDFPITPFHDSHPWSPKSGATYEDHLKHAMEGATGIIVDFSPVSRNALKSASGQEIQNNNGHYVTVKVINEKRKEQYLKDPARIPRVSPGIYDYNFTKLPANNLTNVDIVHLAGVRVGAYGEKARMYASCVGGYECLNHLKGASETNSSLGNSEQIDNQDNIMVENTNNSSDTNSVNDANNTNVAPIQPATEAVKEQQNNNNSPQPVPTIGSPLERLKLNPPPQTPQVKQPSWKEDPDYLKLLKEHEELKQKSELADEYKKYGELIPRELFILNGKFDMTGYNKEIEKAVAKKLDPEYAKEYYKLKLDNVKLGHKIGKPFGASESKQQQYQTPDTVPELKGASESQNEVSSQFQSIINLRRMVGLVNNQNNNNGGQL